MAQLADKVKDHFLNPRNVGKLESANAVGDARDARRNSNVKLFLKLDDKGKIERLTYQIFNNATAIAPASAFTELATGKTLSEASEITRDTLMSYLECDEDQGDGEADSDSPARGQHLKRRALAGRLQHGNRCGDADKP